MQPLPLRPLLRLIPIFNMNFYLGNRRPLEWLRPKSWASNATILPTLRRSKMAAEDESLHSLFERVWRHARQFGMRYFVEHPLPVLPTGKLSETIRIRLVQENLCPNPPGMLFCYSYLADGSKLILIPQWPENALVYYNPEVGLIGNGQMGWSFHHYSYTPTQGGEAYRLAGMLPRDHVAGDPEMISEILRALLDRIEINQEVAAART